MSCLRLARTMRHFLLTLSSFYKSIICLLFGCTDYTIISPFLEAMPRTVSPEQLLGRGEVVVKILSIGTLPPPAMMSQEGIGTYAQQLTILMGYGLWNMESASSRDLRVCIPSFGLGR